MNRAEIEAWIEPFLPSVEDLKYAIKGVLSLSLALFISMNFDFLRPSWAVVSAVMLHIRPQRGMVTERAFFLVLGSLVGVLLGGLILKYFMGAPELAFGAILLLVGCTATAAATVRHTNFVYGFAMVSGACLLVVLFSIMSIPNLTSQDIFQVMVGRFTEVVVGAGSAVFVSHCIFPSKMDSVLRQHAKGILGQLEAYFSVVFTETPIAVVRRKYIRGLITAIELFNDDTNAGLYERAQNVNGSRYLINRVLSVVSRLEMLQHLYSHRRTELDAASQQLIDFLRETLPDLVQTAGAPDLRVQRLKEKVRLLCEMQDLAEEKTPLSMLIYKTSFEIFGFLEDIFQIKSMIAEDKKHQRALPRLTIYRNPIIGLVSGLRTMLIFIVCVLCWFFMDGQSSYAMMLVLPVLMSHMFGGLPATIAPMIARKIVQGAVIAVVVLLFFTLGALAQSVGSIEMLLLIVGGPLFVALLFVQNLRTRGLAIGFILTFLVLINPSNQMTFSALKAINMSFGLVVGVMVLWWSFHLFARPFDVLVQHHVLGSIGRDMRQTFKKRITEERLNYKTGERLIYLVTSEVDKTYSSLLASLGLFSLYSGHLMMQLSSLLHEHVEVSPDFKRAFQVWQNEFSLSLSGQKGKKEASDVIARADGLLQLLDPQLISEEDYLWCRGVIWNLSQIKADIVFSLRQAQLELKEKSPS